MTVCNRALVFCLLWGFVVVGVVVVSGGGGEGARGRGEEGKSTKQNKDNDP